MSIWDRKTREGIPLREYRPIQLLLAIPLAILLDAYFWFISLLVKENPTIGNPQVPPGSIIVLFHYEMPICLSARRLWKSQFGGYSWLGIHNWISYVTSALCYTTGLQAIRFDRRNPKKPMELAVEYLQKHPETNFALRTDAGGPYNVVRSSVIRLAAVGGRPIVCLRQRTNWYYRFLKHYFPLPGASISTYISEPIPWSRVKDLSMEEGTAFVQKTMDDLINRAV